MNTVDAIVALERREAMKVWRGVVHTRALEVFADPEMKRILAKHGIADPAHLMNVLDGGNLAELREMCAALETVGRMALLLWLAARSSSGDEMDAKAIELLVQLLKRETTQSVINVSQQNQAGAMLGHGEEGAKNLDAEFDALNRIMRSRRIADARAGEADVGGAGDVAAGSADTVSGKAQGDK